MTTSELILSKFHGRADYVAVGKGEGFEPAKLKTPLKAAWLDSEHLSGKRCLGFYLLQADNCVNVTCVDFDNKPDKPDPAIRNKVERTYYALCNLGLSPVVEISASGNGAHVWLFLHESTPAWIPRAFWSALSKSCGVDFVEIYPRQDRLKEDDDKESLGNLIRYPLWNKSRFVDVESDWKDIDITEALKAETTDGIILRQIAYDSGWGQLNEEKQTVTTGEHAGLSARVSQRLSNESSLLARRWKGEKDGMLDPSNSALCQSIACELVRTYVPTQEIESAIKVWCNNNGYDKGEREDWVSETVRKAYDFILQRQEKKSVNTATMDMAVQEYIDLVASGGMRCLESGLPALDRSIEGIGLGEMCVVAARTSHAKTAFALQWLDQASLRGVKTLIISEEMSRIELGKRALCTISEIEQKKWPENIDRLRIEAHDHYSERTIAHIAEGVHTIDRAEELIDQYCQMYGVTFVVVDYMQLLSARGSGRYEIVTEVSQRLKKAATRNKCCMLALAQLNREIEDPKRRSQPRMSDIKESGSIEQDADLILFLVHPWKFDKKIKPDIFLIYCAKRRNGPIHDATIETTFEMSRQRFGIFGTNGKPMSSNYDAALECDDSWDDTRKDFQ